jgi:hypothetical protein
MQQDNGLNMKYKRSYTKYNIHFGTLCVLRYLDTKMFNLTSYLAGHHSISLKKGI